MLFVVLNDEFQNRNEPDEFLISLAVLCINCLLLLLEDININSNLMALAKSLYNSLANAQF